MKVKGRYVAQVIIDIDMDSKIITKPVTLSELHKEITENLTPALKELIEHEVAGPEEGCTVDVIQQYADLYEAEENQ